MKKSSSFFVFIVILAIGLMVLIVGTQVVTTRALGSLEHGNDRATLTFAVNNRLEDAVNLSFEMDSKINTATITQLKFRKKQIADSLTKLGYNFSVIRKIWSDQNYTAELTKIESLIDQQIDESLKILQSAENIDVASWQKQIELFRKNNVADSVYIRALNFQKSLEESLGHVINENSSSTARLAQLNRLLAIVAVLAIVLLVTIIIRRQNKQLILIKELEEAEEAARNAAAVKDQFLANMSHELRTPLNALKGFSKLLSQTTQSAEQQRYTSIIRKASDNLLMIVNEVLDFAKIEAGSMRKRESKLNLAKEMASVQAMFEILAEEKKIDLQIKIDDRIRPVLYGDLYRLHQILVNLVGNAIKFTEEGTVQINCTLIEETPSQSIIQIEVADTGLGISSESLETIFERFEQVDNTFTRRHGGTGLGLAIVKKLVLLLDGTITVKSEINRGSSFIISMPFPHASSEAIVADAEIGARENLDFSGTFKVLVVEDNDMNRLLMENILGNNKIESLTAENGEAAIAALASHTVDVVLMDIQMPVMDGIEATKIIRKKYGLDLPIIAMTAHVMETEKQKALAAGMNGYLEKPISESKLLSILFQYNKAIAGDARQIAATISKDEIGLTYLRNICNGNEQQVAEILEQMCVQIETEINQFSHAIRDKDIAAIRKYIHNFKSTLMPIDADAIIMNDFERLSSQINAASAADEILENSALMKERILATRGVIREFLGENKTAVGAGNVT